MKNDELRNPQVKHRHSAQRLVSAGMTTSEIAAELGVAQRTVRERTREQRGQEKDAQAEKAQRLVPMLNIKRIPFWDIIKQWTSLRNRC